MREYAYATAPAKIILFGEHAVVYGRPAIAVPVTKLTATVEIITEPELSPGTIQIEAPDINLKSNLADLPGDYPLNVAIQAFTAHCGIKQIPPCVIKISSSIPVASGMGSGAAVSVALFHSLAAFFEMPLSELEISELTFEVEKIHHGTPSGIDNTVIAFGMPVYFVKGQPPQTIDVGKPMNIIIGDTGIASSTAVTVGDVRKAWLADNTALDAVFDAIGEITRSARRAIAEGQIQILGGLMNENHALLRKLDVSSPELDNLVEAARQSGALGAKLSGGGRGGNMIALTEADRIEQVSQALREAGARNIITTIVK